MRPLHHKDVQVLRASRTNIAAVLPSLVRAIADDLYAHPDAAPYYADIEQVRAQARAWIVGVLAQPDLDALDVWLVRVADIHHAIGIPKSFFVEICGAVCEHVAATAESLPFTEGVRLAVVRTFTRVLFRQAAIYASAPEPGPPAS
jgi:hypothetical protein